MKIASTTLVGPGTLDLLEGALSSVARAVDVCIVIPTAMEVDDREIVHSARRAGVHGARLHVRRWGWCDDFAAARNEALRIATQEGADWALTLDTDERIISGRMPTVGVDALELNEIIDARPEGAAIGMMLAADGSYSKERLIQIQSPHVDRWKGRTHECLPFQNGQRWQIPRMRFAEEPKSVEAMLDKHTRDVRLLNEEIEAAPTDGRWHYYLGQSLMGLDLRQEAINAFLECAKLDGWNEERAWAAYRAAELYCRATQFENAVKICGYGLSLHAGFCELPWLAAFCSYKLGRFEQAVYWSHMAISTGIWKGCGRAFERTGFRHPPAQYDGPFDILAHAWAELGDEQQAHRARIQKDYAEAHRLGKDVASDEPVT